MRDIDRVWARIKANAGLEFRTITGLAFTYEVPGNYLRVSRTVRNLSRSNFSKALEFVPTAGPGQLQGRQGPSYTWAILMDPREAGRLVMRPMAACVPLTDRRNARHWYRTRAKQEIDFQEPTAHLSQIIDSLL